MNIRMRHGRTAPKNRHVRWVAVVAAICVLALAVTSAYWWTTIRSAGVKEPGQAATAVPDRGTVNRSAVPEPDTDSDVARARSAVSQMSLEERVGQLVMAPLYVGNDPSTLYDLITERHVGSVLLIGNWNGGVDQVRNAVDTLRSYVSDGTGLLVTTDQEGGQVQHLQGTGFDDMPSAVEQGSMDVDDLRQQAAEWGSQLKSAGVDVDLAPVVDTVSGDRGANESVGMLDRDFGLDAQGNAEHAAAFIEGMRDAGVGTAIKHYPGLGAVTGNTDFTTDGILDTTTTLDGEQVGAFTTTLDADPDMVMMSLATYNAIDPDNPAAFSSTIIDGYLRDTTGYTGVVTSDSLSATAVSGYDTSQLGVMLVEAGGDLACIGSLDYVTPILDGLLEKATDDSQFADRVTESAVRVMTLKYRMGLVE